MYHFAWQASKWNPHSYLPFPSKPQLKFSQPGTLKNFRLSLPLGVIIPDEIRHRCVVRVHNSHLAVRNYGLRNNVTHTWITAARDWDSFGENFCELAWGGGDEHQFIIVLRQGCFFFARDEVELFARPGDWDFRVSWEFPRTLCVYTLVHGNEIF